MLLIYFFPVDTVAISTTMATGQKASLGRLHPFPIASNRIVVLVEFM